MQAASLLDGFSFDLFPPFEKGLAAPEVDVSRRQVVQALVVSTVVVVPDELRDALFELSWQVVVVQQDPVFHRAMISLDVRPIRDYSVPAPPRPLGEHGQGLWDRVQREFFIQDAAGQEILCQAYAALDMAELLAATVAHEGPMVVTAHTRKTHPAVREQIAARALVCRLLEKLGVNTEAARPGPGRPPRGY